jgi:hypothetical protein
MITFKLKISYYFLLVILVIVYSCKSTEPKTFTLEEKWIYVLMDLYAYQVIIESTNKEQKDSLSTVYKSQITKIHNITEIELDAFTESLANDPDLAVQYYDEAIRRWDEMEQKLTEDHHNEN